MCIPTWVDIVSKLGTPSIGAISAFYVYMQYKRAQRWKAADLAATLSEKLNTDQSLVLACQALDWGIGPLIIPERYRPLFHPDPLGEFPSVMQHDPEVLCSAVEPNLNDATLHSPRGLVYRYCFISLFNYMDNMSKLLVERQVVARDIGDLNYWLERLRDYPYAPETIRGTDVFQPPVRAWGYDRIIVLVDRLKLRPWASPDTT